MSCSSCRSADLMNSFVQRVWAILEEKGIPYQYVEVNPYHKTYRNKLLYESIVVCEFLDDATPDMDQSCFPPVIPSFHRFLQFQPQDTPSSIEQVRDDFLDKLLQFTNAMHKGGPFFMGKEPTLVDFTMATWAVWLWVLDHIKGGFREPSKGKDGGNEASWSRWRKWLAAIEDRKSIKETTSEKGYYLPIYRRYADNTAQSELAKATREGKGVP